MPAILTDFGLARLADTGSRLTRTGQALGTPAYMSPEAARGETDALGMGTDVWSLGCILYELLAGRPAFSGGSSAEVIGAVLTREPVRLRNSRPDVPGAVQRVLDGCLSKLPSGRYRSARALADDLDRALRGERPRHRGRRRLGPYVAAMAAGAAALLASVAVRPGGADPAAGTARARTSSAEAEAKAARARDARTLDPNRAAAVLDEALDLDPTRHDWRLERGLLLWASGRGEAATVEWRRIPRGTTEHGLAVLYDGLEAFLRLDGTEALRRLRGVTQGSGLPGHLVAAALRIAAQDWGAARATLRELPGWQAAILRAYVEQHAPDGDIGIAIREYEQGLREGIPFAWAWTNCGNAKSARGDAEGAIADYGRAIASDPRHAKAWHNRGLARGRLGDVAGALRDYAQAVEADPAIASAWTQLGNARLAARDFRGALDAYDRVVALEPSVALGWHNRGLARRRAGDRPGAIEDYTRALELDPADARTWHCRGIAREELGDFEGAVADYDRALEITPADAGIWTSRGNARSHLRDLARAFADHDRAVALDPGFAMAWNNRGAVRRAQGDWAGALADFERAIALDPAYVSARVNRGTTRHRLGDLTGAIADLEQALALAADDPARRAGVAERLAALQAERAAQGPR